MGAILTFAALILSPGCSKPNIERSIEIWVSPKDKLEILVRAEGEYWSYGSDLRIFNASVGPKLLQKHTVLDGELVWSKENADQALFSFTLSNEQPVTVTILGVTPTNEPIAEKNARRSIFYPPGKHSFKELLFVKYTYD